VGVIAGLYALLRQQDITSAILGLIFLAVSFIVIRAAKRAPPHRSQLHAVFGWLLGFFVVHSVILAFIGVTMVLWWLL
jgi:hypothetical protein